MKQKRLLSITFMLPYSGVDHAGGQFLLHHYQVLADSYSKIDSFAINLQENSKATGRDSDIRNNVYTSHIIDFPAWRKSILGKVAARFFHILAPVFPDLGVVISFVFSKELRQHIKDADVVELQWFEYFCFARFIQSVNPHVRVIGISHDVPSQRIERRLNGFPGFVRKTCVEYVKWQERWVLKNIAYLGALCDKDSEILGHLGEFTQTAVLNPPLEIDRHASINLDGLTNLDLNRSSRSFGFIAAFQRTENDDAALWLLNEIWPLVLQGCPTAYLYLVGSKPSRDLLSIAETFRDSVLVTGYVPDVQIYYNCFDTVIIPLRMGAGIKFKTIAAVLERKNIISTPIGIEGVLPSDYFYCISNSALEIANAMVEIVRFPSTGKDYCESAFVEIGSRFSRLNYSHSIRNLYIL
jgi:hypothetical protein